MSYRIDQRLCPIIVLILFSAQSYSNATGQDLELMTKSVWCEKYAEKNPE